MGTLLYFVKEALRGLFQAKLMTFISIATIGASLFFMSLIGLAIYNVSLLLKNTENQADIAVYLKDESVKNEENITRLISAISSYPQVKKTSYISRDSAFKRFSEIYGDAMLESVNVNPLPASIDIYLSEKYRSGINIEELKEKLQVIPGIESVRYSKEWIDLIEKFRLIFFIIAGVFSLVMLLVLHILISNTIKLTIYARSELVRNMHLVGATRAFINTPFILEGMVQGLVGACLSVFVLLILRMWLMHIPISWGPHYLVYVLLASGMFFGWLGSIDAVRKFVK